MSRPRRVAWRKALSLWVLIVVASFPSMAAAQPAAFTIHDWESDDVRGRVTVLEDGRARFCDNDERCRERDFGYNGFSVRGEMHPSAGLETTVIWNFSDEAFTRVLPDGRPCTGDDCVYGPEGAVALVLSTPSLTILAAAWIEFAAVHDVRYGRAMGSAPATMWLESVNPCMEECVNYVWLALAPHPVDSTRLFLAALEELGETSTVVEGSTDTHDLVCSSRNVPRPPRFDQRRERVVFRYPSSGRRVELSWVPAGRRFEVTRTREGRVQRRCRQVRIAD